MMTKAAEQGDREGTERTGGSCRYCGREGLLKEVHTEGW